MTQTLIPESPVRTGTRSLISARGLTRVFGTGDGAVQAVRGLDLDVAEGELVAFLGPNGAGKSTSLRMLTTLLTPTAGTATVAGCDVRTDPAGVRRRIGYVGQGNGAGHAQRVADELVSQGRATAWAGARRGSAVRSCSTRCSCPGSPGARSARCPVASAAVSTSRSVWCTGRGCSSSTSPRPGSTRRAGPTSGTTCSGCAASTAPRSS